VPESDGQATQTSTAAGAAQTAKGDPLHQPFEDAVLLDPPDDELACPPPTTKPGKVVGKLFETVVASWDQIKFTTASGKRCNYQATIKTDLGTIVLELWPDVAPNHVRSFVALARAGYYDGLEFDRLHHEELTDQKGVVLDYVEGGCPLCTGDELYGSIGYWLWPELNEQLHHEAGTVGASHAQAVESAACKFYITLTTAPWMDGNYTIFGKVTQGLDVVRAIHSRPRLSRPGEEDRPESPVVMRSVVIECSESDRATGPAH
jgi:peptidyl-prolyl cis-trans isomerase B (cyclophilin B)